MKSRSLGRVVAWLVLLMAGASEPQAGEIAVFSSKALQEAFGRARAGDTLVLAPGHYRAHRLTTRAAGTPQAPITVRSAVPHAAIVHADGGELFSIHHGWWRFADLRLEGGPQAQHAFHVAGAAPRVRIEGNLVLDFNSPVKINGEPGAQYPDDGVLAGNDFANRGARETGAPVTFIDLVSASGWVVRENVLADFAKGGGNRISYGIFMKGNSEGGLIERNLVLCRYRVEGGTRVGISLGGGGTETRYCREGSCNTEHRGGTVRNNVVVDCPDVGVYLNRAQDSRVVHNTLLLTRGIDVRFPTSTGLVAGNVLSGRVLGRDGGRARERDNLVLTAAVTTRCFPGLARLDLAPAPDACTQRLPIPLADDDYHGNPRSEQTLAGALQAAGPFGLASRLARLRRALDDGGNGTR